MKKISKIWLVCGVKLSFILIFFCLFLIILPLNLIGVLNLISSIVLILMMIFVLIIFTIFGNIFIKKIINNIKRINEIIDIISKDTLNNYEPSYFDSNNEIDDILDRISEIAFKIKSAEHSKNDFISLMSHELRTPLTAIKGWAETMKTGDVIDFSTLRRGLEVIIKETERLTSIVEELIDFSGFESGRIKINMEKIDILAEISEAVFIFKERATFEDKKLVYKEPGSISSITGDKNRLRQVFMNIIDNAVKYTDKNGIIEVNLEESCDNIMIEIKDNGCGIPEDSLPKVMQKFYKANYTHKGSGIGLAIANEIILLHNGKIEITSKEGQGTKVIIYLPI